ncbi:hypothetical protein B0T20DRAFT_407724 [Sordaria brevicollis]|uniref:S-adenosyl-L-methionine-dependent tRNA 4-demethylwyosine synthase n=1 Tax=Sordaria brevicollis TaxID=83679 RepID=A0AAE0PHL6_SORBR|nr:hypothetical protein B0T20DRAFT_407724 [Sordaria brevicollis]
MAFQIPGLDPAAVAEVARYAVELWHEHRIPILLSAVFLLGLLRTYLHLYSEPRQEMLILPKAFENEKKTNEIAVREKEIKTQVTKKEKTSSNGPKRIKGDKVRTKKGTNGNDSGSESEGPRKIQVLIFYSSLTGNTERYTKDFAKELGDLLVGQSDAENKTESNFLAPQVLDLAEIDYDEYFITPPKATENGPVDYFYLILLPSYNIDSVNDLFLAHLDETHNDFRIDTSPLAPLLGYSVFGYGDRDGWPTEEEGYCIQAKQVDKWMAKLTGRKRAFPVGMGDYKRDGKERLAEWKTGIVDVLKMIEETGSLGEGVPGSGEPIESDDEDIAEDGGEVVYEEFESKKTLEDVEDLGRIIKQSQGDGQAAPIAIDFTDFGKTGKTVRAKKTTTVTIKEMVPKGSPTYTSLTKQGYAIVGSHSGVKICRWTKSALRGRGSCYKYSFYGINSHQCMESTPSLSCSNKCVFCWRHGTNPVGTTWRWVVDPPDLIFHGIKENHYKKIKMMRGVPGVRAERFAEAMRIRHCALSLVGEPIFYPYINEFLGMLHKDRISSFLVCNAQHPDQLAALKHVTQLYVSIDASNKESLRRIDRPLHRDFWERFQRCLEILRERRFRQRTVFRLTLVKDFNLEDEVEGYADLVEKGLPCFVEIKGVTYCGTSTAGSAGLTMANVPFYQEVCDFVVALEKALNKRGLKYGIACEHAHSCCILLASERFNVNGKWHTLIDYDKFFDLLEEKGPDGDFTPEDYMGAATPEWATWGNGGFDPRDQRVDRKGRPIEAP